MSAHLKPEKHGSTKHQSAWVKRPKPSGIADTELATAAFEAIDWLTTVPPDTIKITAQNGWLHLEGTLNSRHQRTTVEEVTRSLPGVKGLIDTITINALSA